MLMCKLPSVYYFVMQNTALQHFWIDQTFVFVFTRQHPDCSRNFRDLDMLSAAQSI